MPANRIRNLFHPILVLTALLIGSLWYIWAFSHYGAIATADFFGDQLGERFSGSKLYLIENAAVYLGSFITQLLPWSALAVWAFAAKRRAVILTSRQNFTWLTFAAGWVLFLFFVFTCGNIQRTRYFLPAYPFLGLLYALPLLEGADDPKSTWVPGAALKALCGVAGLAGLALAVFGLQISRHLAAAGLVFAVCAAALLIASIKLQPASCIAAAAACIVLLFTADLFLITPAFVPPTAADITNRLIADAKQHMVLPMAGMDVREASQIRLLSAGKIDPYVVADNECDTALKKHGRLVCTQTALKSWQPTGVTLERCASGTTRWKFRDYVALCLTNNHSAFLESKRLLYYLVVLDNEQQKHRDISQ